MSVMRLIRSMMNSFKFRLSIIMSRLRLLYPIMIGSLRVGDGAYIGPKSIIKSRTIIGDFTRIDRAITIKGNAEVLIGRYCAFGADIKLISSNHRISQAGLQALFYRKFFGENIFTSKGPISIGNDVWLGDGTVILSGVSIGDGAVIGAASVVTRNVGPYEVHVGNPAKKIKDRFSKEVKDQLLQLKWWDWSPEKIMLNREFFLKNLNEDEHIIER